MLKTGGELTTVTGAEVTGALEAVPSLTVTRTRIRSPWSPLPAVARSSVEPVAPAMSSAVARPLVARGQRVAVGVVARDGRRQRLARSWASVGRDRDRVDDGRAVAGAAAGVSGGPAVQVGPFVERAGRCAGDARGRGGAGALVEAVAGDQAGAARERVVALGQDLRAACGRRSRCGPRRSRPGRSRRRRRCEVMRGAERGVLDAVGARRLADGEACRRARRRGRAARSCRRRWPRRGARRCW